MVGFCSAPSRYRRARGACRERTPDLGVLPGLPLKYLWKPNRQRGKGDRARTGDTLGKYVGIELPELLGCLFFWFFFFPGKATDLDFYVSSIDFYFIIIIF